MSANRIFLVCAHHQQLEDAFSLAERAGTDQPYTAANLERVDEWFSRHRQCGRGLDHFKIAYHHPQDWDVPLPAEHTVAGRVRLALVNGSGGEPSC